MSTIILQIYIFFLLQCPVLKYIYREKDKESRMKVAKVRGYTEAFERQLVSEVEMERISLSVTHQSVPGESCSCNSSCVNGVPIYFFFIHLHKILYTLLNLNFFITLLS